MVTGIATLSNMGVPYVLLGEQAPSILVIPGIEPEHRVPDGLRLQGVRAAFDEFAERHSIIVAWRAEKKPEEISLESIAEDYVDLALQLELTDLTIIGISTGCPMAIETAARLGKRCIRLILISGGAYISKQGAEFLKRTIALAQIGNWRRLAREQIAMIYPGLFGSWVLAPIAWLLPALFGRPADPSHFVALTTVVVHADLRVRCKDVGAPVLLINGERDRLYPPAIARETALLLTDGDVMLLRRAGHGAFKSHASGIVKLIKGYL
jgi:pimeloyl-ACP methyl ester carboxylesterase